MKKRSNAGLNVGGSSIMMIFVLLCLTTFATLSLVSAKADMNLTNKSKNFTMGFYEADGNAEMIYAKINRVAAKATGNNEEEYLNNLMQLIQDEVKGMEFILKDDAVYINYAVPISEYQELRVLVHVRQPSPGQPACKRQEWYVYNTGEWDLDDDVLNLSGLPVFDD